MKKLLALTVVLALTLSTLATFALAYNGVTTNIRSDMTFVDNGPFISGTGNGNVNPGGTMTRAELAQIIYNMFGESPEYVHGLKDRWGWYEEAITGVDGYDLFNVYSKWDMAVNTNRTAYSPADFSMYIYEEFGIINKGWGPYEFNVDVVKNLGVKNAKEASMAYSWIGNIRDDGNSDGFNDKTITGAAVQSFIKGLQNAGFLTEENFDINNPPAPFIPEGSKDPAFEWVPYYYFHPTDKLTREELAIAMYRLLAKNNFTLTGADRFPDVASLSEESRAAINALADAGIIKGMPDGTFNASGTCTRAEVVVMLVRTLGDQIKATTRTDIPADLVGHWSQDTFMKAVKEVPPGTVYTPELPKHDHEFVPLSDKPWRGRCACGEEKIFRMPTDAELGLTAPFGS